MRLIDSHTHTHFSYDGNDPVEALVSSALQKNVSVLTITDHCDIRNHPNGHEGYFAVLKQRRQAIVEAQEKLAEEGLPLLLFDGVELGDVGNGVAIAEEHLAEYPYDFVLGSVHHALDGMALDIYNDDPEEVTRMYFQELTNLVAWGGFDSLAHLDYPVFLWKTPDKTFKRFEKEIDRILAALAKQEKALEVNVSGLFKHVGRMGPERWVLERFKAYGGRYITVGTDSHRSSTIGSGIDQAYAEIQAAGFDSIVYYKNREPVIVPLA